ncbi:LysM peptidoglycan-binding domain-containing protein [Cytobacillus oceanisediminis]|uniref:LysM peptidoglycan-binding domain-containing protein n=1 Tax=Niallia alba TaxID=2729105 RepID=A0A7Y0KA09_9BACI|nr:MULTISPECIES: LysM peptidoglycan-binding domain-containing protein [Bacillaceae]MBQ6447360.1 LysM peptidoglycan-binding domain-containing protein [Bacillus sp. (in: firmicutes)]MBZ9533882.1 LysM peptidoglycan-binding domain-containing protein [Cytobacillus oceanisediminis]NMO78283.1 LysM peptidoglycan-binding domain-containing protein [Niallia alba]
MKKEDPYRVQAETQKQRLKKVTNEEEATEKLQEKESSLPSRSTVHKNKKKKIKIPVISLLAFLFILLPVTLLLINSLLNGKDFSNLLSTESTTGLFENVNIQKENRMNNNDETPSDDKGDEQEDIVIESNSTVEEEEIATDNIKENDIEQEEDKSKENKTDSEEPVNNVPKEEEKKTEEDTQQTNSKEKIVYHTVAKGENLYRIALKYYPSGNGMEKIKAANNMTSDQVQLGQTLKIVIEP